MSIKLWFPVIASFSMMLSGCDGATETGTDVENPDPSNEVAIPVNSERETDSAEKVEDSKTVEAVKLTQATWDEIMAAAKSHAGKIVVLDIWSTSCPPCLREFPNLVDLSEKYPNQVVCLSCSTDYVGISSKPPEYYEERVQKFLTQQKAMFDNYLCNEPADEVFVKIDLGSIPAVYVFGTNGELVERFDNDAQKYGDEFTYADHILPKLISLLESAEE
ncbi:MAG: TlpA disulfide reductase family protein [Planctomycetaceae bacterium]|jgi:thiol-disulfide isomerase/thioredoxin|nr:TlpA family protein disulfide reductase [Planctomycetaceae bacterium]MDG2390869.1 TlpA disulfide reductase family protein [Planctomycetaceae bacterium]